MGGGGGGGGKVSGRRRVLAPEKKLQIFLEVERGDKPVAEVLRREGLYSSDLVRIREQVRQGALEWLSARPGRKAKVVSSDQYEALKRELEEKERVLTQSFLTCYSLPVSEQLPIFQSSFLSF